MLRKTFMQEVENLSEEQLREKLLMSDKFMARIFEDAIKTLINKGILHLRDLPDCSREMLEAREQLRDALSTKIKSDM